MKRMICVMPCLLRRERGRRRQRMRHTERAQVLCEVEGLDVVKDVSQVGQHKKRKRAVVSSDEDESEPEGDEEVIS